MSAGPSPIFVFDAFGTLFDVLSAVRAHSDILGTHAQRLSEIWRAKQLEYTWIYAGMGDAARNAVPDFRTLTAQSLGHALAVTGLPQTLASPLLETYRHLAPFPEVASGLAELKRGGARLAILSNADPDMLDDLVARAGLRDIFEHILSVHDTGTYKPAAAVYQLATDAFDCAPGAITFVSSNCWDCAGAKAFGYSTVWINRASAPAEYVAFAPDKIVQTLSADALKQ